jgi:uncharacterized protein YjbI with pentapeptide repeats
LKAGVSVFDESIELGAEAGGAETGGAETGGAETGGAEASGVETGGAEASGAEASGAEASGAEASGAEASGAETGGAETGGADGIFETDLEGAAPIELEAKDATLEAGAKAIGVIFVLIVGEVEMHTCEEWVPF